MHPTVSREVIISRLYNPTEPDDGSSISIATTIDAYLAEIATQDQPAFHITSCAFDLARHCLVCASTKRPGHYGIWTVHDFAENNNALIAGMRISPTWKPIAIHPTYEAARRDMQSRKPPRRRAPAQAHPANETQPAPTVRPTEQHPTG